MIRFSRLPPIPQPGPFRSAAWGGAALMLMLGMAVAFAAEGGKGGASEVVFLVQLIALMLVGQPRCSRSRRPRSCS
jgi:hypothetical protein